MGTIWDFIALLCVNSLGINACEETRHQVTHYGIRRVSFSRDFLLSLRSHLYGVVPDTIPPELCRAGKKLSRRKRGRTGRIRCKLKHISLNNRRRLPPLPTLLLSNLQTIRDKLDELESWVKLTPEEKGRGKREKRDLTDQWRSQTSDAEGVYASTLTKGTAKPSLSEKAYALLILNCWPSLWTHITCRGSFNNCFLRLFTFIHGPTLPQLISWLVTSHRD